MKNTPGGGGGYPTTFQPGARRLDGGGRTNPITLPMLAAGLRQVCEWHQSTRIQDLLAEKVDRIKQAAAKVGLVCPPDTRHFVGIYANPTGTRSMQAIHQDLKQHGVVCSLRSGALRVSPHLYNTSHDIDRFCALLKNAARQTRTSSSL
mmetsp:Transcript_52565/g.71736  ORF Transcript_52565/g.71736 Transcript_52565/m.71736 type:complete len:149 (-) Transcript_52565:216-662(-)